MSDNKTSAVSVFQDTDSFANAQRMVAPLTQSELVPAAYRNNIPNCMIALEMANRIQMSPLMVMQNLNIIHGRQSWGSSFVIALINSCGRFSPIRFKYSGEGDSRKCFAYAKAKEDGEMVEGSEVSIQMAKSQGWFTKNGSKWPDMPELMLSYRAAAFFGRVYCPDVLMGLQTDTEIIDMGIQEVTAQDNTAFREINSQVAPQPPIQNDFAENADFEEIPETPPPPVTVKDARDIETVSENVTAPPAAPHTPPVPPIAPPPAPPVPSPMQEDDDF